MVELITKYFANTLTSLEKNNLLELLENQDNKILFEAYIRDHYNLNLTLQDVCVDEAYLAFLKQSGSNKKPIISLYRKWYKVAAVLIIMLGITSYIVSQFYPSQNIITNENSITLTLDNGDIKIISENGDETIVDSNGTVVGKQEGTILNYTKDSESNEAIVENLVYNELAVPYGKIFQLALSDGTLVHLNAGTTIKYPVKFLRNRNREVFIDGEAYFEVTKDEDHPFVVNSKEMNIRVLGTKFNINSYSEDLVAHTVLVEGLVSVYDKDSVYDENAILMAPDQIAFWDKNDAKIKIRNIDIDEYIAWVDGRLVFKIRPFSEITKILERHFDVSITNNYKALDTQRFFAKFETETIEDILISFQNSYPFSYQMDGNNVIIDNP
ncbi:FecR family protein [Flavivirga spongiicola]|uniref:FecR domain-containing protein n=1 Tax=Flavivirga spongiicola TaxID=421621 RepID=A0ABU7XVQ7_9FLAO|nr:FecR domain-containing protein [Flavivirga sp. MEBiC05379]MDO5979020.1 FecR domain-containing protein [Flavivirga sp. MEBiC05379]